MGRIAVVEQRDLRDARRDTLMRLFAFLRVDDRFWSDQLRQEWHVGSQAGTDVTARLRAAFADAVRDDVGRLRQLTGRELPHWST